MKKRDVHMSVENMSDEKMKNRRPSRRTLLKGAAWAAPAVTLAAATPAFAASPVEPSQDPAYFATGGRATYPTGGGTGVFTLASLDNDNNAAVMPSDTILTITPSAGANFTINSVTGGTLSGPDGNGVYTVTATASTTISEIKVNYTLGGPVGSTVTFSGASASISATASHTATVQA
jgi:hypothetical protein